MRRGCSPEWLRAYSGGIGRGVRYSPYGYKYNKANKLLGIDDAESKVVKIIYEMCSAGKSIRLITEYLTQKKYRNRKGNIFSFDSFAPLNAFYFEEKERSKC